MVFKIFSKVKFGFRKDENFVRFLFLFVTLNLMNQKKYFIFLYCFYEGFLFIFENFNLYYVVMAKLTYVVRMVSAKQLVENQ